MPTYHPSAIERTILDPFTDEDIPEYQRVALAFLASYRNASTRTGYGQSLKHWFAWCLERGYEPLRGVKRAHIDLWLRICEEQQGLAARTIVGRCNALSGYYKYAFLEGYIEGTPMLGVKRPRIQRVSSTNYLTRTELHDTFKQAMGNDRDLAILYLLGLNGLRVSEVVSIDIEDIGRRGAHRIVTIHRKGDKIQDIPLSYNTAQAVEIVAGDRETGPLFVSRWQPDKRLDRNDVGRLVKRYVAKAGIKKRISPHSFRHSFVTLSLNAGVAPRHVQHSAGHADPRMVDYYDRNRENLAQNATHALTAFIDGAE